MNVHQQIMFWTSIYLSSWVLQYGDGVGGAEAEMPLGDGPFDILGGTWWVSFLAYVRCDGSYGI